MKKILTIILALLLLIGATINAYGYENVRSDYFAEYQNEYLVYREGVYTGVNAFLEDGEFVLSDVYRNIRLIFPEETNGKVFPQVVESGNLDQWATAFGYEIEQNYHKLFLSKKSVSIKNNGVIVNGKRIAVTTNESVVTWEELQKIFPKETYRLPYFKGKVSLKEKATEYGYSFLYLPPDIFINNNRERPIILVYNGKTIRFPDQQPIIRNDRTMIPIRTLAENFGMKVEWNASTQEIAIRGYSTRIDLKIDGKYYFVNGIRGELDSPPILEGGRTLIPIRFVAEGFGMAVEWLPNVSYCTVKIEEGLDHIW